MCNRACIDFVERALRADDVVGKHVLEVGSRDVNGSVRPTLQAFGPASYLGVDIEAGPGVDEICDVAGLVERFGKDSFDLVVSTEVVEHVRAWQDAFWNMKSVLRSTGKLVVTTRSPGFPLHGYPQDFWRYTEEDMRTIFADFQVDVIESDALEPGVFVAATKPERWEQARIISIPLHSVVTGGRHDAVSDMQLALFRAQMAYRAALFRAHMAYRAILPESVRGPIKRVWLKLSRSTWTRGTSS